MEQPVLPLHHVHSHVGEAHVVFHEEGDGDHRLDHLVHQQELLGVLQVPLSQVHVGARVNGAALGRERHDRHAEFNRVATARMATVDRTLPLNDSHSACKSKRDGSNCFSARGAIVPDTQGLFFKCILFWKWGGRENHRGKTALSCF